jgi:hypothetical protein
MWGYERVSLHPEERVWDCEIWRDFLLCAQYTGSELLALQAVNIQPQHIKQKLPPDLSCNWCSFPCDFQLRSKPEPSSVPHLHPDIRAMTRQCKEREMNWKSQGKSMSHVWCGAKMLLRGTSNVLLPNSTLSDIKQAFLGGGRLVKFVFLWTVLYPTYKWLEKIAF